MGTCNSTVLARIEASGGQPTGTTASDTQLRISPTASPNRKICTSWPASAKALACRKGNAAQVGVIRTPGTLDQNGTHLPAFGEPGWRSSTAAAFAASFRPQ